MSNFLKKFTLQFQKINYKFITLQSTTIFMNQIKNKLYN